LSGIKVQNPSKKEKYYYNHGNNTLDKNNVLKVALSLWKVLYFEKCGKI